jgi:hypothetical protein
MPAIIKGVLIIIGLALVGLVILPLAGPFFEKLLSVGIKPSQVFVLNVTDYNTEYMEEGSSWEEFAVTEPVVLSSPENPVTLPPEESPASFYLKATANKILGLSSITLESGSSSCSDSRAGALENIRDVTEGKLPYVCSSGPCVCKRGGNTGKITLSQHLLDGIAYLANYYGSKISFTSLTGGIHGTNSNHYNGTAVDIIYKSGGAVEWNKLKSTVSLAGAISVICEAMLDGITPLYLKNCDFIEDGCYDNRTACVDRGRISNIHIHAVFPSTRPPPQP